MTILLLVILAGAAIWLALKHTLNVSYNNKTSGHGAVEHIPAGVGVKWGVDTEGTVSLSAPQLEQARQGLKQRYPDVVIKAFHDPNDIWLWPRGATYMGVPITTRDQADMACVYVRSVGCYRVPPWRYPDDTALAAAIEEGAIYVQAKADENKAKKQNSMSEQHRVHRIIKQAR